ncbi:hypothetical protein RHGRI_015173 [Rhododendron griersonianum]|uniref:FK506-binding protein 5 n=1 Tax=Rhododendron griersonianum TaxID=479676 RepID=A0AAV6KCA6_9ERIC|nr:hypothetical protein RHGRI_015173 [Rhododendron griersonianum]
MSSFTNTPNFDNLLLQTLMTRLQIRPTNPPPFLNQTTLEDLLVDPLNLLLSDSDEEENDNTNNNKTQLAKEESKLEKAIIRTILSGKTDTLKPNSGQAVTVNEHHICVGFHRDAGSEYRVWEWHGHVMLFDEENGYSPEYIYGNYFEVVKGDKVSVGNDDDDEKVEEKIGSLGLRELIGSGDSGSGRVVHRNVNAGSPRLKLLRLHLCLLCSQFSDYLKQFDVAGSPKFPKRVYPLR